MSTSIFLAQAFSLYLIIIGLAMLFKRQRFVQVVDDLVASPASIFIIAVITLMLGILLVLSHNVWVANWQVVITLLAWLTLVAGIVRTFFPEYIVKMAKNIHKPAFLYTAAIITLVLGAYLGYMGFFAH